MFDQHRDFIVNITTLASDMCASLKSMADALFELMPESGIENVVIKILRQIVEAFQHANVYLWNGRIREISCTLIFDEDSLYYVEGSTSDPSKKVDNFRSSLRHLRLDLREPAVFRNLVGNKLMSALQNIALLINSN